MVQPSYTSSSSIHCVMYKIESDSNSSNTGGLSEQTGTIQRQTQDEYMSTEYMSTEYMSTEYMLASTYRIRRAKLRRSGIHANATVKLLNQGHRLFNRIANKNWTGKHHLWKLLGSLDTSRYCCRRNKCYIMPELHVWRCHFRL
jgi:hypothetical protein